MTKKQATSSIVDALTALLEQVSADAADSNQIAKCNVSLMALTRAVSKLAKEQETMRERVEQTRDGLAAYNCIIQGQYVKHEFESVKSAVLRQREVCAQICEAYEDENVGRQLAAKIRAQLP